MEHAHGQHYAAPAPLRGGIRTLGDVPPTLPPGPVDAAERVILRKVNRRAPSFLAGIVRRRLPGHQVEVGERLLGFQVAHTVPGGTVEVTATTVIEFLE